MSDFTFNSNTSNAEPQLFCMKGHEYFIDNEGYARLLSSDSNNVCAKILSNKKSKTLNSCNHNAYYVKINSNIKLYNPVEHHSVVKDKNQYNFINSVCKNQFIFKEVNQQIFQKYLQFLNTKNIAWLKEAERDIK